MRNRRYSKMLSILLMLALSLMLCIPSFAEDGENGGKDNNNTESQTDPEKESDDSEADSSEPSTPSIHTVVHAWDVIGYDEENASYGSEEQAAQVLYYMAYEIDEEKAAEANRQVEEAEKRDQAKAEKEAEKLAEELVENGRYKELIGENNRYEKDWYYDDYDEDGSDDADDEDSDEAVDEGDDEDPGEDIDYEDDDSDADYDEEDKENVHSNGPYYSKLKDTYPHILRFWFESDGKYHFDYDVDYSGIDFDSVYIEVPHDTFHVKDTLSYKDFTPQTKYSVQAQLVRIETNESGETSAKETFKELETVLDTGDATEGELSLDFGELKLDLGSYVVLVSIKDENGAEYLSHSDLNNKFESLEVSSMNILLDSAAKGKDAMNRGDGQIKFPAESTKESSNKSPNTGDDSRMLITLYALMLLLSMIVCFRIAVARIGKGYIRNR